MPRSILTGIARAWSRGMSRTRSASGTSSREWPSLFEQGPHWKDKSIWTKSDVARIRYTKADGEWTLYCRNQNGKRHIYEPLPPTPDFGAVLGEIKADPTGIFWG